MFILSGLAGAGKTVALNTLEDLGFYCVDNLPISLLPSLLAEFHNKTEKLALAINSREIPQLQIMLPTLREQYQVRLIFLDASNEVLARRYGETRRVHPFGGDLNQAIELERSLLAKMKCDSEIYINTSHFNIYQLRDYIRGITNAQSPLLVSVHSFGFKHGLPLNADFVFDARFLPNPYWVENIRKFTGLDAQIVEYFQQFPQVDEYAAQIGDFLQTWIAAFQQDKNRAYLTIAIGCTGGKHRSVYIAESIAKKLNIPAIHRDINK